MRHGRRDLRCVSLLVHIRCEIWKFLTLVPGEVPLLQLRLLNLEVLGDRCSLAVLGDCERELLVQRQSNGLRPILRLVDFETNVEELTSKEVGPVIS